MHQYAVRVTATYDRLSWYHFRNGERDSMGKRVLKDPRLRLDLTRMLDNVFGCQTRENTF